MGNFASKYTFLSVAMPSAAFTPEILASTFPDLSGFDYLKSGSFKSVYRVKTKGGANEVLKIIHLPPDVSTNEGRAFRDQELGRAKREIEVLATITSPFVVKLGTLTPTLMEIAGESCLVYTEEALPGRDLEAVIVDGEKPTAEEIKLLLRCLVEGIRALWSEHRTAKMVHRDIKPANVFATGDPARAYVLLDLGIAYNVSEPGLTVNPAHIPATPLYMAPEMLDPNFRETLSYRADLYSAGVTVFQFATGKHPLAKTSDHLMKTLTRILHQEPTRLADERPDLPGSTTALVDQLMKKNPALRPGNFALILNQLK